MSRRGSLDRLRSRRLAHMLCIILAASLCITENRIGAIDLLQIGSGMFLLGSAGKQIRMIFLDQLSMRRFYLRGACGRRYIEHLIKIRLDHSLTHVGTPEAAKTRSHDYGGRQWLAGDDGSLRAFDHCAAILAAVP